MRGLLGHTGFVGSNLLRAGGYDATFNSRNVADLAGRSFDEMVCAALPAAKWIANREPEADRAVLATLISALSGAKIGRFVLISTIDVYPNPASAEDETACLAGRPNHAYGCHRLEFEEWARERYPDSLIVRLPALYGPGLKKNALFDLLNDNQVDRINPASVFQWYGLQRLPRDLEIARSTKLEVVNLFTEPLRMSEIIATHFPDAVVAPEGLPPVVYALRTRHAALFGGSGCYIETADQVRAAIASYLGVVRSRQD
jgi:hypothetical protein